MKEEKWTFVTTYFRNHGVSYFEMILKALCEKPISHENLSKNQSKNFDQIKLVKKVCTDFPKSIDQAIYLVPEGFREKQIRYTATYNPWHKRESDRLNDGIRGEYEEKAQDVINRFNELLDQVERLTQDQSKKFVPDHIKLALDNNWSEMHDLWHIIHELPLNQQIKWFEKFSHFKDKVAVGTWDEVKNNKCEIKIVKIGNNEISVDDISSWVEAISDWIDEMPMDRKFGVNLYGTSTENQLAWRYLKERKIKLKQTIFFDIKTKSFDDEPRRFRTFQFKNAPQNLIDSKDGKKPENKWYSLARNKALEKFKNFKKWSDLFPIIVFGDRGTGKSRMIREVFSKESEDNKNIHEINCAAIPESLAESILFGHTKGSFTGAVKDEPGAFGVLKEYMDKDENYGVLFLDEFHYLPKNIQSKLLVALQADENGEFGFTPIGKKDQEKVKFQLILGTNRTEEKLREEDSPILPDFLDRVMQRKVHMPNIEQKEIIGSWQKVWKQMGFMPKVDDPLSGDYKDSFSILLSELNFPGNFRDIERLCILTADIIRENDRETINTETFEQLRKEVEKDGGWKKVVTSLQCDNKGEEALTMSFDDDWYNDPQKTVRKVQRNIAEKLIESYGGKTQAIDAIKKLPGGNISLTTLRRWLSGN